MKKKQKVKERHVGQLRKLIGAVTEQNGEEGTLPMSFSPLRVLITILSDVAIELRIRLSYLHLATSPYLVHTDCRLRCRLSLAPQRNIQGVEGAGGAGRP